MLSYEDDLESSHEEEAESLQLSGLANQYNGSSLLSANDDYFTDPTTEESKNKIPIPPYMKGSNVIEFNEELETL